MASRSAPAATPQPATQPAASGTKETEKVPTLRIGNKGEGKHIRIPFTPPTTVAEFYDQFTNGEENEEFLMDLALRGLRIKIQDLTRDMVAEGLKEGKSPQALVTEVLQYLESIDITEKKERKAPTPRKPVDLSGVSIPEDAKAALFERLRAAGVKIAGVDTPA